MRRLFLLISITTAALFSSYDLKAEAPERQGWKEDFPLYGDVESVVETRYKLEDKFGEVVRGGIRHRYKYYFNYAGDVIKAGPCNSDGSLSAKWLYKYDSYGNMIEIARYRSNGSLVGKDIYKYDSSGNMVEEAWYDSYGSLNLKLIYKYDSRENMIERARYKSDGSLIEKGIYKYDSSGNKIEEAEYQGKALIPASLTVYEITYRN